MSVPAISGPVPQSPGARQKTITELLTQWADLTNDVIAATGDTEGWKDGTPLGQSTSWDAAAEKVSLPPCSTVGPTGAHQVRATVYHAAFGDDPHPVADKLTAYWESQGFTVTRTVDWTSPSGRINVVIGADRCDGLQYVLTATNDIVAIGVSTECSSHPSIQSWAREKSLRNPNSPTPSSPPSPTESTEGTAAGPDDWFWGF